MEDLTGAALDPLKAERKTIKAKLQTLSRSPRLCKLRAELKGSDYERALKETQRSAADRERAAQLLKKAESNASSAQEKYSRLQDKVC